MDRTEFIERLQRALASGVNSGQVAEHIRYYQEYIDSELSKGRSEAEIMTQLGDPRLLAKSIIEANKRAGTSYGSNREYDEEVAGDTQDWRAESGAVQGKQLVMPGWLVMLIITVIVLVIIGVATALLSVLAPVIIVVLIVVLVVKSVQGWRR